MCVLFNHPYPENIPALEDVYRNRFRQLRFVVPQYETGRPDTLTVFRGSNTFQGMVVDALPWLPQDSEWYIFTHDDAFMRPDVNEGNIVETLRLCGGDAFIPRINPISWAWAWSLQFVLQYINPNNFLNGGGLDNLSGYLPPRNVAWAKAARYGIHPYNLPKPDFDRLEPIYIMRNRELSARVRRALILGFYETAREQAFIDISYPFVSGMSDFFIVHRSLLAKLRPILGAFTAAGFFAEIAIPTALLLVAERLVQANASHQIFDWAQDRSDTSDRPIDNLFNRDTFLIHPIKLGQLKKDPDRYKAILAYLSNGTATTGSSGT